MSRTAATGWLLAGLGLYVGFLLALQGALDEAAFRWTFSEAGPFERSSEGLWLLAAAATFLVLRPLRWRVVSIALVFVLFAGREADLHKAFTHGSITKINYYVSPAFPLWERVLAALIVAAIVALAVDLVVAAIRFAIDDRMFAYPWSCVAGVGVALLGGLKVLDRSEALLQAKLGIGLPEVAANAVSVIEEGLECALPLVFLFALQLKRRELLLPRGVPEHGPPSRRPAAAGPP